MPKLKSHSGAKKRFKTTGKGKIRHKSAGARHLLAGMPAKRGRRLRRKSYLRKTDEKMIKRLLPFA